MVLAQEPEWLAKRSDHVFFVSLLGLGVRFRRTLFFALAGELDLDQRLFGLLIDGGLSRLFWTLDSVQS